MNPLIAIVGPTGIGKSILAIKLAGPIQGEIISCDSRQVYHYMDIGTAKPSPADRMKVPHHLIDIINPDEELSLAGYQAIAYQTIDDVHSRQKIPLLVGGTGQYFWAVVEGWEVPRVPPDTGLRKSLEAEAAAGGIDDLYAELKNIDPEAAQKIDSRNVRRVIRALEVYRTQGSKFSELQRKKSPPYRVLTIGLTLERAELYHRVDLRVDRMLAEGLVAEVANLLQMGYNAELPAMSGIGYRQIIRHLKGELTLDDAVQQIKFETHRYIRQQYAWFRLKDERIHWFNLDNSVEKEINIQINDFLQTD